MRFVRFFSRCNIFCRQLPESLKGRSKSSHEWLIRQLKDPYVEKARMENYRFVSTFQYKCHYNSAFCILSSQYLFFTYKILRHDLNLSFCKHVLMGGLSCDLKW